MGAGKDKKATVLIEVCEPQGSCITLGSYNLTGDSTTTDWRLTLHNDNDDDASPDNSGEVLVEALDGALNDLAEDGDDDVDYDA